MRRVTELYLERVFNDMRREDMNVIRDNLKRMIRPDLVETLLTNEIDSVWISADSIFEMIRNATKDTFEKVFKIANVKSDNMDDVVKEYRFKVGIDDFGDLIITIECDVEGLAWTSEEYIDYMSKKSYMKYSENRKCERYNIPFRHERKFTKIFNLNDVRKHVLKSE